ncbi:DNA-binding MarR family transcriptional regulator [Crossiella equi]|uniref:DNA-binding MarR family transcriptional regulator n=1 Tax=Crossiella equi TaxID=130796 RepID=A0ABS5A4W2_9PSEU|nr:MarR family transcriptional regulator [Crossiella equi]MBP2471616.1 DNA-binding MarR family transcriptional regulator [Crossiella equi]
MDGTPGELSLASVFDDLVRCEIRLYNALDTRLREAHGIVVSQLLMLKRLRDRPGARAADLAAHFAIGIGTTSKALDRHVGAGWVQRTPSPADRRSVLLELTPEGREVLAAAEATFDAALRELFDTHADPRHLPAAAALLTGLRRSLEQADVGRPNG